MNNKVWIEITEEEFNDLAKNAVHSHTIGMFTPALNFLWDEEGFKNKDLSWGQHAFLKYIEESKGPRPYIWPSQYFKLRKED